VVVLVVVLDVVVEVEYVPLLDVVVVPVEEAVDGRSAEPVDTGDSDFLVKVGV
tara:strand:+ start:345 stop:503 length:159 start_codon:yes stop_codon:yes gene_type:complete